MADFCLWSVACSPFEDGIFIKAFEHAATEANEAIAESDPVVVSVAAFMIERTSWTGTAAKLLDELNKQDTEAKPSTWKSWPTEPSSFSKRLRKAAAVLRKLGIAVEIGRASDRSRTRTITLNKIELSVRPNRPQRSNRPGLNAGISNTSDAVDTAVRGLWQLQFVDFLFGKNW